MTNRDIVEVLEAIESIKLNIVNTTFSELDYVTKQTHLEMLRSDLKHAQLRALDILEDELYKKVG